MAKKQKNIAVLIIGLIVNLILPGLGTLIFFGKDKRKNGVIQLILAIVGALTAVFIVGYILGLVAWIWALIDSIKELAA